MFTFRSHSDDTFFGALIAMDKIKLRTYFSSILQKEGECVQVLPLNPLTCEGLAWVESGLAKIYGTNEKGLKVNTDLIFEQEFVWLTAENYQSNDLFFLECMKNSKLRFLPINKLDTSEREAIPSLMLEFYQDRLRRIHQQKVKNFDLELQERVFFLLFDFSLLYGKESYSHVSIPNFFTHDDLASILKNCRQNITACLNDLKKKGIISYTRKEITISKDHHEQAMRKYYKAVS
ncbi:Crp/Fnr family transcriptional regulator [Mongoliitalea daihaiensis]|uniref:Crp/Fnr family transcriptional regulator n=1 Tax=Mongoliitalea daihaiensis TaxID=2782006 RepID=UPI001F246BFD|nr:Crp/Fnr family transcriptional regulator [Mongoliitalea daihaiensis]UJP63444.1 Crp/Fnr family transcriptional regulator [Mongoliitalea daihaiensis]